MRGMGGVLTPPTLIQGAFQEESSFTRMINEKGPNQDLHTSKHSSPSERLRPRGGKGQGAMLNYNNTPTLIELGPPPSPVLRVGGSSGRGLLPTVTTPFSREIIEAPHPKKFKMLYVEPFDGVTDPDDHLDVYKAQMYVQEVDDDMCCRYFPTTLRGMAQ